MQFVHPKPHIVVFLKILADVAELNMVKDPGAKIKL